VSSTAILVASLRACDIEVEPILPDRLGEGYGFGPVHAERAAQRGAALVVTVDCGTTAHAAVDAALERGLEVIVVDHHQPGSPLPDSVILVNPLIAGPDAPGVSLAAAGLAYKVAVGLFERLDKSAPARALVRIAAIGTIADMVPLLGENRVLAAVGLRELGDTRSVGLRALYRNAGIDGRGGLDAEDIAFRIAPRINAAGRLGSADPALDLLLTRDDTAARSLAAHLEEANTERRAAEELVVSAARDRFERLGQELPPILVEWDEQWHRGVVGIAAGKLARAFNRPTILLGVEGETATGSGRSIPGVHLHQFLSRSGPELARFGGHEQAIGLSVPVDRLEGLRRSWIESAGAEWPPELLRPRLVYDAHLDPAEVTPQLADALLRLGPHGSGNPRPLLRIGPMMLAGGIRNFGKSESRPHLGAQARPLRGRGPLVSLIGWGWSEGGQEKLAGEFEVVGEVQLDRDGLVRVTLSDARPTE
jgi:single-stranded-DNA-specific exonuclease